jgi:hypothetical protein
MAFPVRITNCIGHLNVLDKIVQIKKPPDLLLNITKLGDSNLLPKVTTNVLNESQELGIADPAQESITMPH